MNIQNLDIGQLESLLRSVFGLGPAEKACTIFVDLPNDTVRDNLNWMDRRRIAAHWYALLEKHLQVLPFSAIHCCSYENVGMNNADLPLSVTIVDSRSGDLVLEQGKSYPLHTILESSAVVLALTELSATAPLKILARRFDFRAATLPGFTRSMIPALGLDYERINGRVMDIKHRMDRATEAALTFETQEGVHQLVLDLRFRTGHASGGVLREKGSVGNLPSGEAYIVPYEGEQPSSESRSEGVLPVQFKDEVVLFRIHRNSAVEVLSSGLQSDMQRAKLSAEPAYGNIAELGIGVLGEWGVQAVGSTLLDEKLGLHVAFGRSDHFGGVTSPESFRDPAQVIHIDWVYVPSVQSLVRSRLVELTYPDGGTETIMRDGRIVI